MNRNLKEKVWFQIPGIERTGMDLRMGFQNQEFAAGELVMEARV